MLRVFLLVFFLLAPVLCQAETRSGDTKDSVKAILDQRSPRALPRWTVSTGISFVSASATADHPEGYFADDDVFRNLGLGGSQHGSRFAGLTIDLAYLFSDRFAGVLGFADIRKLEIEYLPEGRYEKFEYAFSAGLSSLRVLPRSMEPGGKINFHLGARASFVLGERYGLSAVGALVPWRRFFGDARALEYYQIGTQGFYRW